MPTLNTLAYTYIYTLCMEYPKSFVHFRYLSACGYMAGDLTKPRIFGICAEKMRKTSVYIYTKHDMYRINIQ